METKDKGNQLAFGSPMLTHRSMGVRCVRFVFLHLFVFFVSCLFLLYNLSYFQKVESAKRTTFIEKDFWSIIANLNLKLKFRKSSQSLF